jgi:HD-GYP domain-containing protein (c-di-GMP phosphodiesterase class II)
MKIYINDMLYALSGALDSVEAEIFGIKSHHSERVAYVAMKIGKAWGYSEQELLHLAAAAVLHDNALTEYISLKRRTDVSSDTLLPSAELLKIHCDMGEKNVQILPFYDKIRHAVLYHHENADGSGPNGLTCSETPAFAQLIHFADQLDNYFTLDEVDAARHEEIHAYAERYKGSFFSEEICRTFHEVFPQAIHQDLYNEGARTLLHAELKHIAEEFTNEELRGIATMFARIVDYKSHFTCNHSLGIANKAQQMGEFYGYSSDVCTKLYLAGAFHDIGKLTISNDILEKPDRLTGEEYEIMKGHALASWKILRRMQGMENVTACACMHHEKLDGSGYPFGKNGQELNKNQRLLACLDIYQALVENRPYRKGMSHNEAMEVLHDMGRKGFIDEAINNDIDTCFANI